MTRLRMECDASPMTKTWDVVVIGGGMLGLSTSYHLAKMGAKTLLLQAGPIGSGTSAANAGRAQVSEGHLDPLNIRIIREGLARFETLEEELGTTFEWRRNGYLCLIKTEQLWRQWEERSKVLTEGGILTQVIDLKQLQELEPHLNPAGLLGAAYTLEGLLNPFRFCWAYATAARRYGTEFLPYTPATSFKLDGKRIRAVCSNSHTFQAERFAVMCGAWTPVVTRMAGVETPIRHTHAEAFILEPTHQVIRNTIGLADFYEIIHGKPKAVAIGIGPQSHDTLLVTESVIQTDELHTRNSAWGVSNIAFELLKIYPALGGVRVIRAWGAPTSFTPDEEPLIGWIPERENLFVASSMVETITAVPLISEWMAKMILEYEPPASLQRFSPSRFASKMLPMENESR